MPEVTINKHSKFLARFCDVGLAWRSQGYGMDKSVMGFTNLPGALSNSSGNMLEETYFG